VPPAIFVYGHTATGKTLVISRVLEVLQYSHAVVNCVECYVPQLLFEPILNKIHGNYKQHSYASFTLEHELSLISHVTFTV
jgi:Cdc6-like AAA superfamily ATPase